MGEVSAKGSSVSLSSGSSMCSLLLSSLLFVKIAMSSSSSSSKDSEGEIEEEEEGVGGFCAEFCPSGALLACSCCAMARRQERTML